MPRHAFRLPAQLVEAVKRHVSKAIEGISPVRYKQEPNYTAALIGRLDGFVYESSGSRIEISGTVFDDRGPNSAEKRYGADHAITAIISDRVTTVRKAILVQAKLGTIDSIRGKARDELLQQIEKMRTLTPAPKVMEIVESDGHRVPRIISANRLSAGEPFQPLALPDYFSARVLTTLDGCTNPSVVEAVQDSSLSRVGIQAFIAR
jgi:hypothetical protein